MTYQEKTNVIDKLAKGHVQRAILYDLLNGDIVFFKDYIKTKKHYQRYVNSFHNLISRLEAAGYNVIYRPGKNGGSWTASIKLA